MQATSKILPQVPRLRTLWNAPNFVRNPIPVLSEYADEFGPTYSVFIGGSNEKGIVTIEPSVIQHVLQKKHRNYIKTYIQTEKLGYFVGQGLLTVNGNYWLQQRRLIQPGFHRRRLTNLVSLMQTAIDDYLLQLDQQISQHPQVDIYQHMLEMAFTIISSSLFSTNISKQELDVLSENITILQEFVVRQVRQPYFEWWYRLSGQLRKHKDIAEDSKDLLRQIIRDRKTSKQPFDDLLAMLLEARYADTEEGMTETQLLDETLVLFVAGHETSANALAWTLYLLSQHPWAVQRIQQELETVTQGQAPTFEQLPKLQFLRQVIEESMRIYPPVWITDRASVEDDEIDGYHIKKGDTIVPYIYGVHHNPVYWPNPSVFDPDRFSPDNKKKHIPFTYLPFGGGPRLCIGNNFAMMEMQLILASMVRKYQLELIPGQMLEPFPLVTLRPKNGILMNLYSLHSGLD